MPTDSAFGELERQINELVAQGGSLKGSLAVLRLRQGAGDSREDDPNVEQAARSLAEALAEVEERMAKLRGILAAMHPPKDD